MISTHLDRLMSSEIKNDASLLNAMALSLVNSFTKLPALVDQMLLGGSQFFVGKITK